MARPTLYEPRVQHTVRLPPEMLDHIRTAAAERGLAANQLMVIGLQDFLDRLLPVKETKLTR